MGLSDLKKPEGGPLSPRVDAFVRGAKVAAKPKTVKKYKRVQFSLDQETDDEVDRLSLIPRTFRVSRSKVVRVALALLAAQSDEEVVRLMEGAHGE